MYLGWQLGTHTTLHTGNPQTPKPCHQREMVAWWALNTLLFVCLRTDRGDRVVCGATTCSGQTTTRNGTCIHIAQHTPQFVAVSGTAPTDDLKGQYI